MTASVIGRIVEQNLGVYRAAPSRLQEDLSQEAQVASDYRGRLVYELLQNADDAMEDQANPTDRISFLITDEELWMANTGRPLTDEDVQGLCGLGASSKVDAKGVRRASIGHKGLGFKSVLEISARPAAFSRTLAFELGVAHARPRVETLYAELGRIAPQSFPAMRFPAEIEPGVPRWLEYAAAGYNTAFRFPLRDDFGSERRIELADRLLALPLTTVLFLKHLEEVEVVVEQAGRSLHRSWKVTREAASGNAWQPCSGLMENGLYRVAIDGGNDEQATFLVAHRNDISIGKCRSGLTGPAWEGVEIAEVSVALNTPALARDEESGLDPELRRFHVFLPTQEHSAYPLLVNGAFATDLSRQHVRVESDENDYNSHLLREAARLFRDVLVPVLLLEIGPAAVLYALDRGSDHSDRSTASGYLHEALTDELSEVSFLHRRRAGSCVFPRRWCHPRSWRPRAATSAVYSVERRCGTNDLFRTRLFASGR